jgi:hypothetical protein
MSTTFCFSSLREATVSKTQDILKDLVLEDIFGPRHCNKCLGSLMAKSEVLVPNASFMNKWMICDLNIVMF